MKRQLGILVLVACMILATVPTALCATQNGQGQNSNYDISVTVSDTNTVKTITMEKGEILRLIVKNYTGLETVEFDPDESTILSYLPIISSSYNVKQDTLTEYHKAIAVSDGYLTIKCVYSSGNIYTLNIKIISQNGQGGNEQ